MQQDPIAATFAAARAAGEQAGSAAIESAQAQAALAQSEEAQEKIAAAASALPEHQWETERLGVPQAQTAVPSYSPGYDAAGSATQQYQQPMAAVPHPQPMANPPAYQVPSIPGQVQTFDVVQDPRLGMHGSSLRVLVRIGGPGDAPIEVHLPLSEVFRRIPPADIQAMLSQGGTQPQPMRWELRKAQPEGGYRKGYHQGAQPPAQVSGIVNGSTRRIWQLEDAQRTGPAEGVATYRLIQEIKPLSAQEQAAQAQAHANAAAMAPLVGQAPPPPPRPGGVLNPLEVDPGPAYSPPPGEQLYNSNPWTR